MAPRRSIFLVAVVMAASSAFSSMAFIVPPSRSRSVVVVVVGCSRPGGGRTNVDDDDDERRRGRRLAPTTFEEQLAICERIAALGGVVVPTPGGEDGTRACYGVRFADHPRCTARFGEALSHALLECCRDEDDDRGGESRREGAVRCASAIASRAREGRLPREGMASDLASALSCPSLRSFRIRQIVEPTTATNRTRDRDFSLEDHDAEIVGRLYRSAILATGRFLDEVGLTRDHLGFTILMALCRAASSLSSEKEEEEDAEEQEVDGMARLDAALSDHFNGIAAPGCRFKFSRRHGISSPAGEGAAKDLGRRRSRRLVVAFSSLGNGLVRHEFGGSLAIVNNERMRCASSDAGVGVGKYSDNDDDDNNDNDGCFDVLFVADPSQSWYQKDSRGRFGGFSQYESRIRAASRPYSRVSLVGDSMGGSAALLFSHLATDAVVAFSPQVDLEGDVVHVGRADMTPGVRVEFRDQLFRSVGTAVGAGVYVVVHRGVDAYDVGHSELLEHHFSSGGGAMQSGAGGILRVVEHRDCLHHQIAVHLKERGQLAQILSRDLLREIAHDYAP